MASKQQKETYNLDKKFECVLITALCFRPKLYARIGNELVPDLLNSASATLAYKAARAVANDKGTGSDSLVLITQRLRRWYEEGKTTQEEINDVLDFFDDAEDAGIPSDESIIEEIAPILKHRAREAGVHSAIETLGKHGDMNGVVKMLTRADRIGKAELSTYGTDIRDFLTEVQSLKNITRLPTGMVELDQALMGGIEKGSLYCFAGGAKEGKSMALCQVAAHAWIIGMNVVYISLELNKAWTMSRFVANITGISINQLINGSMDVAQQKMKAFWEGECPGMFRTEKFTPNSATIEDVIDFTHRVEDKEGEKVNLIVVDYADKLVPPEGKRGMSEYVNMRHVYETYRIWIEEEDKWGWTASQMQRKAKDRKRSGGNDLADSQNKVRVLDGLIALNKDGDEITLSVEMARNIDDGVVIGPFPTDFAHGRLIYLNKDEDVIEPEELRF